MDPATIALGLAAVQRVLEILNRYTSGDITKEQADAYFQQSSDHYNAAVARWNAAPAPTGG